MNGILVKEMTASFSEILRFLDFKKWRNGEKFANFDYSMKMCAL